MGRLSVLLPKLGTLYHAEAMLLIDHHEPQVMELNHLLYQCMGAYQDVNLSREECAVQRLSLLFPGGTGEQSHSHLHPLQHLRECVPML